MTTVQGDSSNASMTSALTRTLQRRAVAQGTITLPAVPALLDEYVGMCLKTFGALGVEFDEAQTDSLRDVLRSQLDESFAASPRSNIVITYDMPVGHLATYHVRPDWASVEDTYNGWVATREPPYFGTEPDARVWALALEYEDPRECPVLDVGAGTGRNSLALARRGHPVDALEMTGNFADILREDARAHSLGIRVIQRDLFSARDHLPGDYKLVIVSEVTPDFRSGEDLRRMFEVASSCLAADGCLVLNAFLTRDNYAPDVAARQVGQQTYTAFFTREEVNAALAGLPLLLVDDVSVLDYEKDNQLPESWPPTGWYEGWVQGQDLFALAPTDVPIEMRWLVYRKSDDSGSQQ